MIGATEFPKRSFNQIHVQSQDIGFIIVRASRLAKSKTTTRTHYMPSRLEAISQNFTAARLLQIMTRIL